MNVEMTDAPDGKIQENVERGVCFQLFFKDSF